MEILIDTINKGLVVVTSMFYTDNRNVWCKILARETYDLCCGI